MDDNVRILLLYGIIPSIIGGSTYFMKSLLVRISNLESTMPTKLDEKEVRQLLSDKLDPVREDLRKLEGKLDKITDILLNR